MADDWDDWGDGDEQSDGAKSEGWDWPADERRPAASAADKNADEAPERMASRGVDRMTAAGGGGLLPGANDQHIEEKERLAEQMDKMTEKFFVQLQRYLEDLADPSAREEINEVMHTHGCEFKAGTGPLPRSIIQAELQLCRLRLLLYAYVASALTCLAVLETEIILVEMGDDRAVGLRSECQELNSERSILARAKCKNDVGTSDRIYAIFRVTGGYVWAKRRGSYMS